MMMIFAFLAMTLATAVAGDYLDPAVEQRDTVILSMADVRPGENPPVMSGEAFVFKATEETAMAVATNREFDVGKGIKISFDVLPDLRQSNPFPRILETSMLSVHFSNPRAESGIWEIKALSQGVGGPCQAIAKMEVVPARWHHVAVRADVARHILSIQVDDGEEVRASLPPDFVTEAKSAMLVFGNVSLGKDSRRGFCGSIRDIRIVNPFRPDVPVEDFEAVAPSTAPLSHGGEPIEYVTAIAMPHRNFYFPGFAVLADGSWACVAREGEFHVCPYGRAVFSRSLHGFQDWCVPVCVADSIYDVRDPGLVQLKDGRLLLIYRDAFSWNPADYPNETAFVRQSGIPDNVFSYQFSYDNGVTWAPPVRVPGFCPHGPAFHDGHFYQPNISVHDGRRFIDLLKGNAVATQWETIATIAESPTEDPGTIQEPHLVVLEDGTMVCAIRVHTDGYMRIAHSLDEGHTWNEPVTTNVRGFPQHLLELPDGRLLATYGYRYYPMGVRACFSYDKGRTWDMENEIVIRDRGMHGDLGYPVSALLPDGRIATCYYYNSKEHPSCYVEIAIWKP